VRWLCEIEKEPVVLLIVCSDAPFLVLREEFFRDGFKGVV